MDRKYTCFSEDDDQFVDTNVGRKRRLSIDIEDINQYGRILIDTKLSIGTKDNTRLFDADIVQLAWYGDIIDSIGS